MRPSVSAGNAGSHRESVDAAPSGGQMRPRGQSLSAPALARRDCTAMGEGMLGREATGPVRDTRESWQRTTLSAPGEIGEVVKSLVTIKAAYDPQCPLPMSY
jgi:hypothetical protein